MSAFEFDAVAQAYADESALRDSAAHVAPGAGTSTPSKKKKGKAAKKPNLVVQREYSTGDGLLLQRRLQPDPEHTIEERRLHEVSPGGEAEEEKKNEEEEEWYSSRGSHEALVEGSHERLYPEFVLGERSEAEPLLAMHCEGRHWKADEDEGETKKKKKKEAGEEEAEKKKAEKNNKEREVSRASVVREEKKKEKHKKEDKIEKDLHETIHMSETNQQAEETKPYTDHKSLNVRGAMRRSQ